MRVQLSAAEVLGVLLFAAFAVHSLFVRRLHRPAKGPGWRQHLLVWLTLIAYWVVFAVVPLPVVIVVICLWSLVAPLGYLWLQARGKAIP